MTKMKFIVAIVFLYSSMPHAAWQWSNPTPQGAPVVNELFWLDGSSRFVGASVVSVTTSTDAVIWSRQGFDANISDAVSAGGVDLLVGSECIDSLCSQAVWRSQNGGAWTKYLVNTGGNDIGGIASNGTKFVMTGHTGLIMSSSDGIEWEQQTSLTTVDIYDVVWAGNQFVAVGRSSTMNEAGTVLTSPDGVSWTKQMLPQNGWDWLIKIAWSGSRMVALGANGSIATSSDGVTWSVQKSADINWGENVIWAGNKFIISGEYSAFPNSGYRLIASTDGVAWSVFHDAQSVGWGWPLGIAWNGDRVYVSSEYGVSSSTDGVSWTYGNSAVTRDSLARGLWNGSAYVALASKSGAIATSINGDSWTLYSTGISTWLSDLVWNGALYVAVGAGGTIVTSPDSINWTPRVSGTVQDINAVAWNGSQFVAVGDTDYLTNAIVLTSSDGINWTAQESTIVEHLRDIVWAGDRFVIVGDKGAVLTSANGSIWTTRVSGTTSGFCSVAWSGDILMASTCGDNEAFMRSIDAGTSWTRVPYSAGLPLDFYFVTWDGSRFLSTSVLHGNILVSTDGTTWTITDTLNASLNDIVKGPDRYVALGWAGAILVGDVNTSTNSSGGGGSFGIFWLIISGMGLFFMALRKKQYKVVYKKMFEVR